MRIIITGGHLAPALQGLFHLEGAIVSSPLKKLLLPVLI